MSQPQKPERFVEYSAGSNALPWIGWMEDAEGKTTGFVTLDGSIWRYSGDDTDAEPHTCSRHNAEWNAIRDLVYAAEGAHRGDGEHANYWPENPVSCLVSLALKAGERAVSRGAMTERSWGYVFGALRLILYFLEGRPQPAQES